MIEVILSFEQPKKVRDTETHNKINSSDCGVPGTYVENMSREDSAKWKAKLINGDNKRVEIRKSNWENCWVNLVIIVSANDVIMSMNGKLYMTDKESEDLIKAINEAKVVLDSTI